MTVEEVRTYLKSYRNLKDKADYLQNKLINVKAISYRDSPTGSYSEPKTQNDYILMKDRCLEEMALIRQNIDKLDDINHRDVLFYRYIELMSIYDTADMLHVSQRTAEKYIHDAIEKMIVILS
jgi:DNA-directed RNA polymerase specialized sigma24 family protein